MVDPAARYAMHEGIELAFLTAIQRLPGRQRAILILRDVLGWTAGRDRRAARVDGRRRQLGVAAGPGDDRRRAPRRVADRRRAVAARAALGVRRPLGARRRRRAGRAAARGRRDPDAAATLDRRRPRGGGLLQRPLAVRHRRSRERDDDRVGQRPARGRHAQDAADDTVQPHGVLLFQIEADEVVAMDAFIDPGLVALFERE